MAKVLLNPTDRKKERKLLMILTVALLNGPFIQSFDKSFVLPILAMFIYMLRCQKMGLWRNFMWTFRKILKFKNGVSKYACTRVSVSIKVIIFWLENGKFEFSRKQYIFLKHSKREICAEFYYHFQNMHFI
jgi:hypothetical protein